MSKYRNCIRVFLCFCLLVVIACGKVEPKSNEKLELGDESLSEIESEIEDESLSEAESEFGEEPQFEENEESYPQGSFDDQEEIATSTEGVDLDLTTLSSTMVYAEVSNMMMNPEEYMGKRIQIQGIYSEEYWEETDTTYHYVIISDAMACCQSGLEFICERKDNQEEVKYPELESEIRIIGTFTSYEEQGVIYYYLAKSIYREVY